jgi:deoxyribodipyrimidine photo-lyase
MQDKVTVFWFRRDLRCHDNAGLFQALQSGLPVLPVFIFDRDILDHLPEDDARLSFIHKELHKIDQELKNHGSALTTFYGKPKEMWKEIISTHEVDAVFTNRDYEPYALEREEKILNLLTEKGIKLHTFKDQVIFEKEEIVKQDGNPYVVYTPYKNKWTETLRTQVGDFKNITRYPSETHLNKCVKNPNGRIIPLEEMGFTKSSIEVPAYNINEQLIADYDKTRDYPAKKEGTSRLGIHLRFGTVSVRDMVEKADQATDKTFLSELIWREFFMQILYHYPHTTHQAFKPKYDRIEWRNNEEEFEKWKNGQTGYKLVDAGMRELNTTGHMHNRVRMLVASFLCKHLLIDWRWGERYFAEKLLDYELASNVGNWQWAAGSGVDAAPYFRIFNPITQKDKFDKQREYINRWVPEHRTPQYTKMMVDHKQARERCLATYKAAVS